VDAYAGAIFSNLMAIAMIIATAATLHAAGRTDIATAADAARAREPVAGKASEELFGVGLLGASLLAAAALPLATSYATGETFGFAKGVNLNYRRARSFFTLFTGLLGAGAAASLIHNLPVIKLLLAVAIAARARSASCSRPASRFTNTTRRCCATSSWFATASGPRSARRASTTAPSG
jgi:Mn2+/Fe2+ NRAMP family transporter